MPITGIAGVDGCAGITTFDEADEVQPTEFVTVKLYVPDARLDIVFELPDPLIPPGLIIQLPAEGKPFKITLPVDTVQVGGVMVPTPGAEGVMGWLLITTSAEAADVQPEELVTV
jgi:hypothetical protein